MNLEKEVKFCKEFVSKDPIKEKHKVSFKIFNSFITINYEHLTPIDKDLIITLLMKIFDRHNLGESGWCKKQSEVETEKNLLNSSIY